MDLRYNHKICFKVKDQTFRKFKKNFCPIFKELIDQWKQQKAFQVFFRKAISNIIVSLIEAFALFDNFVSAIDARLRLPIKVHQKKFFLQTWHENQEKGTY